MSESGMRTLIESGGLIRTVKWDGWEGESFFLNFFVSIIDALNQDAHLFMCQVVRRVRRSKSKKLCMQLIGAKSLLFCV